MLECYVLPIDYAVSYGSATLKSLQNDNVPELDLLVREAIQNSSDAALQEPGDSFKVNFTTGQFCPSNFNFFISELDEELNRRFPGQTADFMEIRDTKTAGLTGCIRKSEITDGDHGNFFKLIYDTGKRQTQTGAGGNWGFGKSVYYRVGIGIVIFYSRIKKDDGYESRLIVTMVEDEEKPDSFLRKLNSRSAGKAWWGIRDPNDKSELLPITDDDHDFIENVLDVFGLKPFKNHETGTSIIIPYINPQKLLDDIIPNEAEIDEGVKQNFKAVYGSRIEDYLRLAIQKWYCPKIHNRKLKDYCDDKKWLLASVNNDPITKDDLLPFFNLVQELYTTSIAKNYGHEYQSEYFTGITTYPVNIRGYLDGSTSGYVSVVRVSKDDLTGGQMALSPYDYVGHFEADGGLNEPMVMYTRDPGMIIEYSITGAWVKNIPSPDSENEFLFAFFMPDTRKHIKSDLSVKEFAGKPLGEYLRACEASDHMGWADPARMQIVDRIQKNTVNRIIDLTANKTEQKVEATASRLSGKLGRMLLPRVGYAKSSGGSGGSGGNGGGGKIKDLSFDTLSQEYSGDELVIEFLLKFSHAKKKTDISVIVDSEGGRIDPAAWQKDIGTPFPANITALTVHSIESPIIEGGLQMDATCNGSMQEMENQYVKVGIYCAENSAQYSSFSVNANVLNLGLKGSIRIKARDKKYKFSLRIV